MAKRILIIEDDLDILELLHIILQGEGYDIIPICIGMSADDIAIVNPDLIMLDVRINGYQKTGAQICLDLKKLSLTAHLPVLLVSAERNLVHIADSCGANGYIPKPFEVSLLVSKVMEMTA